MRIHYQLQVWITSILGLSLIWMNILREQTAMEIVSTDNAQADLNQVNLANLFEATDLNSEERLSAEYQDNSSVDGPFKAAPIGAGATVIAMNVYHARRADTLWKIARAHNLDVYTVVSVNKLDDPNCISVGQPIKIPGQPGLLHAVQENDTLADIALRYDVPVQSIIDANGIVGSNKIPAGTDLFIPNARIPKSPGANPQKPTKFIKPAQGGISDKFGYRLHPILRKRLLHTGIDIMANYGSPVKAAMGGVVRFSGNKGGYGKLVIIDHRNGYETRYAHNSKLKVKKGQVVQQGQVIAQVGRTGRVKGVHLHFEIRENGAPVNPMKFLKH